MPKLEVCCYSLECAMTAEQAGADRIELCSAPKEGGLTPSIGTLRLARERLALPVHPMVRPRGGDFCYNAIEFDSMLNDLAAVRELGFPGVVIGLLDQEGHIDILRMRRVMAQCAGMAVTFHRAFDMCINPYQALRQLTDLGVARILTSGQQQSAETGLALLRELIDQSRGPIIMAGAGVRLTNLHKFQQIGIRELHSSARQVVASGMRYRKAGVSMSVDNEADEFSRYCVDGDMVAAMKHALATSSPSPAQRPA